MAPGRKKEKKSKKELKRLATERGRNSSEKQGKGAGGRKSFDLPQRWHQTSYKRGDEVRVKFSSPGKSVYKTQL